MGRTIAEALRAEGKEIGTREALRDTLRIVLEERFGSLPEDIL